MALFAKDKSGDIEKIEVRLNIIIIDDIILFRDDILK